MKRIALACFVIGGWTLILSAIGYFCAFVLILAGLLPLWPFLIYAIPILGFAAGVFHLRAIIRSP